METSSATQDFKPRLHANLLLWAIFAVLLCFIIWASLTKIDRTIRGTGKVVPNSRLQIVSNLEGGTVQAILVRAGQDVRKNQLLVRIDPVQAASEYGSGRATSEALTARAARLRSEMRGGAPTFEPSPDGRNASEIASEQAVRSMRVAELSSQIAAARERLHQARFAVAEAVSTLSAKEASRAAMAQERDLLRPLVARGLEPRLALIQAESAAAVAAQDAQVASATLARARAAVGEAQSALSQVTINWRLRSAEELATTQAEISARSRLLPALVNRVDRTAVRAPLDGRVNRVLVNTIGGAVRASEPLVEIVPAGEPMLVEAMINPKDIAAVRMGQPAKVSLTAYDSAIYGNLKARVIAIAPDAVQNERTGESYFLVRLQIVGRGLVDPSNHVLPVGSGMIAEVSLLGERRSIMNYILTPISRLSERAFRE